MKRTTAIILICGAAVAGLALGTSAAGAAGGRVTVSLATTLAYSLPFAALFALALIRTRIAVLGLIILALLVGVWRAADVAAATARLTDLIGQKLTVTGVVADDPAYDPRGFMNFKLGEARLAAAPATLPGEIAVHTYQTNLHRGWRVTLTGKLREGFGNNPVELSYPTIAITSRDQSPLERFRQSFFAGMRTALPEPIASFALGLLVGIRALIPKGMQTQLSAVGLSHLVAVSGYNLTIIVMAVSRLLERATGRGVTLAASLWLIAAFLVVTGASASIVRASLVATLGLLATFYGRRFDPLALISLTAAATALYKPSYLTDLGWLLSFLAFFGIMVLAPAVSARLGQPKRLIAKLFIETTTAQIMTLPLILYFFGDLSIVAPLANLLVLPLVPLAMLFGFVAGLAGLIAPAFAGWLAWPAALFLGAILQLIAALAALPFAATTFRITLPAMLAIYALILLWLLILNKSNRRLSRITTNHKTTDFTSQY